MPGCVKLNTVV